MIPLNKSRFVEGGLRGDDLIMVLRRCEKGKALPMSPMTDAIPLRQAGTSELPRRSTNEALIL